MEKKPYQLMCTYLKKKYFISTIYRESSAMIANLWYFETIAWEWDEKTKKRGSIIEMYEDSGTSEERAMDNHLVMVKRMNDNLKMKE